MTASKILIVFSVLAAVGCVSSAGQQQRAADRQAEIDAICAGADPNDTTVVMQDSSSSYEVAAGAVTASGGLEPVVVAGPGVVTSRGGVVALSGSAPDVEMVECK